MNIDIDKLSEILTPKELNNLTFLLFDEKLCLKRCNMCGRIIEEIEVCSYMINTCKDCARTRRNRNRK